MGTPTDDRTPSARWYGATGPEAVSSGSMRAGASGLPDEGSDVPSADAQRRREAGRIAVPAPAADGRELAALDVIAADERVVGREQLPDLARYGGKDVVRRRALRDQCRHPPQSGLLIGERGQFVTTAFQRGAHDVKGPLQRADLAHAGLGQPRGEVAAGETARQGCGTSNRPDDRSRQVAGIERHQSNGCGDADHRAGVGTVRGVGACASGRRGGAALGFEQLGEIGADGVDAGLALSCRRDGPRRRITPRRRVDEWHRVVVDVRACGSDDLAHPRLLGRVARDEFEQRQPLLRERRQRLLPWHEKLHLAREEEATLPRLQVEHPQFEPIGGDQHVLRMPRAALSVSCILDGEQKGGKHGADDEREGHGGEDHPLRYAAPIPDRPGGCSACV